MNNKLVVFGVVLNALSLYGMDDPSTVVVVEVMQGDVEKALAFSMGTILKKSPKYAPHEHHAAFDQDSAVTKSGSTETRQRYKKIRRAPYARMTTPQIEGIATRLNVTVEQVRRARSRFISNERSIDSFLNATAEDILAAAGSHETRLDAPAQAGPNEKQLAWLATLDATVSELEK